MGLVSELRRRNVFRVALAYVLVAWLVLQVGDTLAPALRLPDWVNSVVAYFLVLGFPLAAFFAWAYELTPDGLKLEKHVVREESVTHVTGRKLDFVIISMLVLAVGYFSYDKFVLDPGRDAKLVEAATEAVTEQLDKTGKSESADKSIAVLAFADMSPEGDQEYFSDGISEELLNVLAKIPGLRVVARTSSFQFKGENRDIVDIGQQLNVAHILDGSVRKSGNKLKITAQLVKADDGFHLWSESYDRELDDIFAVQEEIAAAITDVLKVKLLLDPATGEAAQPAVIQATNTAAYDAYLQGRELRQLRGKENMEAAIRHLERSVRLDERFAPAHAQLALAITGLLTQGTSTLEEVRWRAIPHLDRAEELDPNLAEVHAGRSWLAIHASDYESAIEHARSATAVNPSFITGMNALFFSLVSFGRYEEAEVTLKQMLVTDPLTIVGRSNYSAWLRWQGRVEEARELADQLLALNQQVGYRRHGEVSLLHEGKIAEGLSWLLRAWAEDPSTRFGSQFRVLAFIWVGEYDEARRADDILTYMVDVAEGRFDQAIRATQTRMQQDPDSESAISAAADVLYDAGRIDEALTLYEGLLDFGTGGRPLLGDPGTTMRLAQTRRKAGDEDGAQAAARIARQDHAAGRAAGFKHQGTHIVDAMIAAFEHDPEGVIAALKSAINLGLRSPGIFADPIFEDLWDEPRFVALQQELDTILAAEHDKILQLICFNNPVPNDWQPLPETCEGVEEQQVL